MEIYKLENVTCGYGNKEVLKNISLEIEPGKIIGLIGPNGSGKTTFLRSLTKILAPRQGEILYKGKNLSKISPREYAREVAVIPQRIELPFNTSVEEFVSLARFAYLGRFENLVSKDRKIIEEILRLTDLSGLTTQDIREISGGELQRVILAQGFAQEPKVLILDEPTTHLDITHQIKILDLLKKMNRDSGLSIILSLHDLNLAAEYCDRLILLNERKIFKDGTPQEVLDYRSIEAVYKTLVVVKENPISKKPYVILVSRQK